MIVNNGKHYLYRHIRLDKNEVFYIGIGTKSKNDIKYNKYHRAFSKCNRNQFWHNIVSKTEYKIEIILESDSRDFIIEKEKEFIKFYGRKKLKLGTLCNLTDGGDGVITWDEESKIKHSINNYRNIPISLFTKKGELIGNFTSSKVAARFLKTNHKQILEVCKGKLFTVKGLFAFFTKDILDKNIIDLITQVVKNKEEKRILKNLKVSKSVYNTHNRRKSVKCLNDGNIFKSKKEAASFYNICHTTITNCINGSINKKGLKFIEI